MQRRERRRQRRGREDFLAAPGEPLLGARHRSDHALVGFPRLGAEGEDAVLYEHQPFDRGIGLVDLGGFLGEREARHDVGHDAETLAINLGAERFGVGLIGDAQHRGRMGVVDIFLRQESVQQRLDRGVGRAGVEEIGALIAHHVFIGELVALAQLQERLQPHGGQAGRLDIAQIPAAALDAKNLDLVASKIGRFRLHGGVATPMQDEQRVLAEEPRGVNPQGEIARHALLGIARHHRLGFLVAPAGFHGAIIEKAWLDGHGESRITILVAAAKRIALTSTISRQSTPYTAYRQPMRCIQS